MPEDPFNESDAAVSCTHAPVQCQCQVEAMIVTDAPGLMDTSRVEKDETNIRLIVEGCALRQLRRRLHPPRYRHQRAGAALRRGYAGCSEAHRRLIRPRLSCALRTWAAPLPRQQAKAAEFAAMIGSRTHVPINNILAWQVDCHPEKLAVLGVCRAHRRAYRPVGCCAR